MSLPTETLAALGKRLLQQHCDGLAQYGFRLTPEQLHALAAEMPALGEALTQGNVLTNEALAAEIAEACGVSEWPFCEQVLADAALPQFVQTLRQGLARYGGAFDFEAAQSGRLRLGLAPEMVAALRGHLREGFGLVISEERLFDELSFLPMALEYLRREGAEGLEAVAGMVASGICTLLTGLSWPEQNCSPVLSRMVWRRLVAALAVGVPGVEFISTVVLPEGEEGSAVPVTFGSSDEATVWSNRLLVQDMMRFPADYTDSLRAALLDVLSDVPGQALVATGGRTYDLLPETLLAALGLLTGRVLGEADEGPAPVRQMRFESNQAMVAYGFNTFAEAPLEALQINGEEPESGIEVEFLVPVDLTVGGPDGEGYRAQMEVLAGVLTDLVDRSGSLVPQAVTNLAQLLSGYGIGGQPPAPEALLALCGLIAGYLSATELAVDGEVSPLYLNNLQTYFHYGARLRPPPLLPAPTAGGRLLHFARPIRRGPGSGH